MVGGRVGVPVFARRGKALETAFYGGIVELAAAHAKTPRQFPALFAE